MTERERRAVVGARSPTLMTKVPLSRSLEVAEVRELDGPRDVPLVGDVIAGKYRIDSIAGEGGMGIVYEAEHLILRQRVAIKALLPGTAVSSDVVERFSLEASAAARIVSEHVVRVMDAGSLPNGAPYLVMEYLEGADLEMLLLRRGAFATTEAVDIALQALEALAHAHGAGIIHRDLKPANLFLAKRPSGGPILKLLDFGISRVLDASVDEERVVGSPLYMSPEQLSNAAVDHRTDLWSLGVVLYELLMASPPFGGTFAELVQEILYGAGPPPLHETQSSIPPGLSKIVATCLARDRAERWANAAELARALSPYGSGAWNRAITQIDETLSRANPARAPRRFESFENALQALETERGCDRLDPEEPFHYPDTAMQLSRLPYSATTWAATLPPPESAEPSSMVTRLPARPPPSTGKPALRILLIDDSEISLGIHSQLLLAQGFDVRTTASPGEFEALLDGWRPHLVLMDVSMPEVSGDVLCRRVKARLKASVPIVLMSDLPREVLAERARVAEADAYLAKTSDGGAFVEYVRNICALTYSPEDLP